jgi:peptidoglycan/LPS O-acetylase OafA/YrhL
LRRHSDQVPASGWGGTVFGGASSGESGGATTEPRLSYHPALDGLRAVAVLAVIAYHDAYAWAAGGFLGVDAFFVLSGFLITTLLVLEFRRADTINLLAFWGRRLRRLLPALLLVLLAVAVYSATEVPSIQLSALRGDSLASLFYVANWRFISTGSSYFDMFIAPSPVRHLWSLAIEEQFYLVWPLVVLGVFKLFRGSRRALLAVCVAGIVASSIVMASLYNSVDPSRAYFGTDARIHTILVGAVLALVLLARPPRTPTARRNVQIFGLVGAVGMLWTMHALSDQSSAYYHGGSLLFAVAVAGLIAAVMQPSRTALRLGLSLTPLVWIGRISYGLYLWHWPVNVYLTAARTGWGATQLNFVRLVVTFAFATASYFLVEMPIRRGVLHGDRLRWAAPVAIAGTGLVLIVATVGATSPPSYLGGAGGVVKTSPTTTTRVSQVRAVRGSSGSGALTAEPGVDFRTGGAVGQLGIVNCPPPRADEVDRADAAVKQSGRPPKPRAHGPLRVLVIGDSLGCSFAVGLGPAGAPAIVARQAAIIGCGVVSDQVYDDEEPFPPGTETCSQSVKKLEGDALLSFRPDLVLWISTWERFNFVEGNQLLPTGTEAWKQSFQRRLKAGYARLTANGARLAFVTVAPPSPASMIHGGRIVSPRFDWRFPAMNKQLARFVADQPGARLIDVAAKVCPHGAPCPSRVAGFEPRHGDGVHFDPNGSVWLTRWMLPQILAAASAPPPPPATAPPLPAVP